MHSVALLSAVLAAGALAEHNVHRHLHNKRQDVVETDYAMQTVYQTVTAGQAAASPAPQDNAPAAVEYYTTWVVNGGNAPAPAPTTPSSTYVAPPATTEQPITSAAPASSAAPSSSAAASSASSSGYGSTGVDYVDSHNVNRAKHGAQAIAHDAGLESRAQAIVNNCPSGDKDDGQQPSVGSNWAGGTNLDIDGAMKMWYGEESLYAQYSNNYQSEPNIPSGVDAMHFSQVIWQASTHVGCASNPNCSGGTQITCLYSPQGNFAMENSSGQSDSYVQNVFPPTGGNS